jgi:adenylate kinase family enzyme
MSGGEADARSFAPPPSSRVTGKIEPVYGRDVLRGVEFIAIAGIPGSGKTTLAMALQDAFGWALMSTGDIARRADPASILDGGLANERVFREEFRDTLADTRGSGLVVIDGIPRNREQADILPPSTMVVALTVRPDIAVERLTRRGRSDDTPDLIAKRVKEQAALLEVNDSHGWLYQLATWERCVNTTYKRAPDVAAGVIAYLRNEKRQMF